MSYSRTDLLITASGVHQVGEDIGQRPHLHLVHGHSNHIGLLAHLQRANTVLQVHSLSGVDGGHTQHSGGIQSARIVGGDLANQRGIAHLREHVQIVVGAGRVRSQAHVHASIQHLLHGSHATGELEIAGGVVNDGGVIGGQQLDVLVSDVHAVSTHHVLQHTLRSQVLRT